MHRNGHSGVSLSKCDSLEKSLKESEARFRALTTMAPVGIYLADVKGYFFYVNHRWCEMTGLSPREAVGLDWTNNIYSEDRDRVIKAWHKMVGAKDKFEIEYRCLNKSKKLTWVLSIAIPMINEDGKHTGFIGTCIDITERINAEVGLMESERKYRQLYQGSRDGYVMVDMSGKIIESNDAYKEMLGYSDEELSTKTYYDLTPGKWFDYEDKIVEEQVLIRGFSQLYEKEYIDKKGRIFPIELRTYLVVDKDKNPKAMWAFIRDITERKEIEEKLRLSEERWKIIFE